jgi:hypothetical protein
VPPLTRATRRNIPEHAILHGQRRENPQILQRVARFSEPTSYSLPSSHKVANPGLRVHLL